MTSHTRSPHRDRRGRPTTGTRLVLSYPTEVGPEWIVLPKSTDDDDRVVIAPMTDLALVGPRDVRVGVGPAYRSICRLGLQVAVPVEALASARTIDVLEDAECARLRRALHRQQIETPSGLETELTPEYEEHAEELRADAAMLAATLGGRVVQPQARRGAGVIEARPSRSPRQMHFSRRLIYGSTVAAAVICVIALVYPKVFMMSEEYVRERPGLYAWRKAVGELGFELEIGGRTCLARGIGEDEAPCRICPGEPIDIVYRMDPTDQSLVATVVARQGAQEKSWVAPQELMATAAPGKENCERGLCTFHTQQVRAEPPVSRVRVDVVSTEVPIGKKARRVARFDFRLQTAVDCAIAN